MLVAYFQLCRHCRNLAVGGCLSSGFHITRCHYFLGHVICRNLPWQGLWIAFSVYEWQRIYKLHYSAADSILEVLGLTLLMLVKRDEISLSIINFEIVVDKDIYTVVKLIITLE